jgi:hypothetical protein
LPPGRLSVIKEPRCGQTNISEVTAMTDKGGDCAHPRMCPEEDSFAGKIKRDKLALEPPPPQDLVKPGK